jgi:hypothetical protein
MSLESTAATRSISQPDTGMAKLIVSASFLTI